MIPFTIAFTQMKNCIVIVTLILSAILALICLIMSIVFAYDIALVYPHVYVNVVNATNYDKLQFLMRCDQANNKALLANLLQSCGVETFNVQPGCNLLSYYSYWYQAYSFAEMKCPTGYLLQFVDTINSNVNLVIVASSMMIIGCILFCLPFFFVWCCFK